ncbi:MAG: discoidin domain-containing protein, partial [Pseudoxanthomonas sp.]
MTRLFLLAAFLCSISNSATAQEQPRILDDFSDPSTWRVVTSNQVTATLRQAEGVQGKALCLDYDYHGVSGYAGIQRALPLAYPQNYRFDFRLRGDSPANDLQFKLTDASGDNVWWVNSPRYAFPKEWTHVGYKQRHIGKAWGPGADPVLRNSAKLEYTIYNNAGGKGSVCFDELTFTELAKEDVSALVAKATASLANGSGLAANAVDGDSSTAWYADFAADVDPQLTLDLGKVREFGGLKLVWKPEEFASGYLVQISDDGDRWRDLRTVVAGNGGTDYLALPESEGRYLRLRIADGPGRTFGLVSAEVQPLGFAATPNDFLKSVARESPRGWFPRGFSGEQPYWTLIGLDGGSQQGLVGEDGAIELSKGAPSVEPFVHVDGKLVSWADVEVSQSLQDGYLPIPTVEWKHAVFDLRITAFADGKPGSSRLVGRYRLTNTGSAPRDYTLALAVQPYQVNPPSQFLNTVGGVSRIDSLSVSGGRVDINGKPRVFALDRPDAELASAFESGTIAERLASAAPFANAEPIRSAQAHDSDGLASGAFLYKVSLKPGESRELSWLAPLEGVYKTDTRYDAGKAQDRVAAEWRGKLDRVGMTVPAAGQALVDTLRTATAHMLISRIGPRLQPGTRSYGRSWIRDGAMISEGLLRMGREEVVRDYVAFYAPFQFKDGMVPCCVDDRGSDPVP